MFLVCIDAYLKWPEAKIMSSTTVSKTLNVLWEWFATHRIQEHIIMDNGPQFVTEEFATITKRKAIKYIKSAPYHPVSNDLAEMFIISFKQSLKASEKDNRSLCQKLNSYLLDVRITAHSTTGAPRYQLLLKPDLQTRLSLLWPSCETSVLEKNHNRSRHTIDTSSWELGSLEIEC